MREKLWLAVFLGLLFGLFWAPALAIAAKPPTVAVMPFRDLTGDSRYVGEAIRETVTTDLKQLGSLRVVERGSLDKVLAEQGLQVQHKDMDMATVVKLGKVLGASLVVLGAYQKMTPQVRLTARFVKVETSEVIGTAKVDGTTKEFLRLQDRVTSALLHSAGFAVHAKQVLDGAERRPDLASLKTLEFYGQALTAENDVERRQYLTLAVAEDKNFSYALRDLEALERRLEEYQRKAREAQEQELSAVAEKLRTVTDPGKREELVLQRLTLLMMTRRYNTVVREARAFIEGLPAGAPITQRVDLAASQLLTAQMILHDNDGVLRDGERYLRRAPGSTLFDSLKRQVDQAIAEKRRLESERQKAEEDVASMSTDLRWDLCMVATRYHVRQQYPASRRLFEACFQTGSHPRSEYMLQLASGAMWAGDFKEVRRLLAEWEKLDAAAAAKWKRDNDGGMPVDE
jgi:TolB-like protein